jgi:predicted permease
MHVYWRWDKGAGDSVSGATYAFWKEHARSFEAAAGYAPTNSGFNLAGGAEPLRVRGLRVSESFLRVLGTRPALGRDFAPEEDSPGGPCAALVGHGLWRDYFGGDAGLLGRQVELNGRACSVVGVLPAGFQFATPVDVLLPMQLRVEPNDQGRNTGMIVRLRRDVTEAQAQAEMDALMPLFRQTYPGHAHPDELGVQLVPYQQSLVGGASRVLLTLFGAVGLVLLIACANVANLLLARGSKRRGELAVRAALGAGRWRLVRQLMTENMLLALAGGAVGLVVALWSVPVLVSLSPAGLPRAGEITLDARAVAFALLAAAATSLLFGVVPAWQASRVDLGESLKAASGKGGAARGGRLRGALIVAEVALSLVLLVGAGLLVQSFLRLRSVELGFDPENLTTMQASFNSVKYTSTAQLWETQRRVVERLRSVPGVEAVATVPSLPMERGLNNYLTLDGLGGQVGASVESRAVGGDYFRALRIGLLRGRALADSDAEGAPRVVVVNETLARRFWPGRDPVGERVYVDHEWREVVGVAGDVRETGLDQPPRPTVYVPAPQVSDGMGVMTSRWFLTSWIVRTSGPVDVAPAMRAALREADPSLPVANVRTMGEVISGSITSHRFILTLMSVFAALALVLTAVGLYGVLSYQVSQRTHEIGIRLALGARPRDVMRLVVVRGMALALAGIGVGLAGALLLTRLMTGLLYGVSAADPLTYAGIALLLVGVALLACLVPARRATKVDPVVALRYE